MQQRRLDLDVSLASWAVILGGLSVVVGSLLPWFRGIRRAWILLQSLIALAVSTYEMLTYRSQFVNDVVAKASARIATPPVDVRARVSHLLASGQFRIQVMAGIYVVLAGGIIGVLGGLLLLRIPR